MNRNLAVGIFSFVGLALFTAGLFMIGNRHQAFSKHYTVYADFTNLSGLAKGSKVQVAGLDAGQVEEIHVPKTPAEKFRLKLRLDESSHGLVRADSVASIGTEGVVGDTFLSIAPGSASVPVAGTNAVLPTKEAVQLSDLVNQANVTVGDIDLAVKNANGLLAQVGGNLNATLTTARGSISDVDKIVRGIERGDGTVGMLLRDPRTAESVRQTLANADAATQSLQHASAQVDDTVTDLHARELPQKIDDTIGSIRDASSRFDSTSKDIQTLAAQIVAPGETGETVSTNLRQALSNVNAASGNFVEDTEALKHNFLTKGFFRHRGYFGLTGMTPNEYRSNAAFINAKNPRIWLPDAGLFMRDRDGNEQLSAPGKAMLDDALNQHADLLQGVPIMVEGYVSEASTAQQVGVSRERALLVRAYLVSRYRLEPTSVGGIGLGSQPAEGSAHASWNGVAVVFVRAAH
jgi:phospholipid/cholesterol/gamma-HCH transport system substrate-binding protein